MKVSFEIDYDEARRIRKVLSCQLDADDSTDLISAIDNALQNEDERHYDQLTESLMESGGRNDSEYRQSLRDSGRGHLLR